MLKNTTILLALISGLMLAGCPQDAGGPMPPPADIGGDDGGRRDEPADRPTSSTTTLNVRNLSDYTVFYLYVSPSSSSSWGSDQLGSHVVSPGQTFRLNGIPCGTNYDLKAEGAGHTRLATRFGAFMSCDGPSTWTLY